MKRVKYLLGVAGLLTAACVSAACQTRSSETQLRVKCGSGDSLLVKTSVRTTFENEYRSSVLSLEQSSGREKTIDYLGRENLYFARFRDDLFKAPSETVNPVDADRAPHRAKGSASQGLEDFHPWEVLINPKDFSRAEFQTISTCIEANLPAINTTLKDIAKAESFQAYTVTRTHYAAASDFLREFSCPDGSGFTIEEDGRIRANTKPQKFSEIPFAQLNGFIDCSGKNLQVFQNYVALRPELIPDLEQNYQKRFEILKSCHEVGGPNNGRTVEQLFAVNILDTRSQEYRPPGPLSCLDVH